MKSFTRLGALALLAVGLLATHLASANTALWIGNPGVSATTNWSDNANWSNIGSGGVGPLQNDVVFGGTGSAGDASTITSVVDINQHPLSMTFTNALGQYHTIYIPAGVGLTNDNGLSVGGGVVAIGQNTFATIFGEGEFDQNGAMTLNGAGGATDSRMLLDMSGLGTFKDNAPTTTMNLGTVAQTLATLNLASNSFINVATLNLETTGGVNGRNGNVNLGATTNTIWANNINISTGKGATCNLQFTNSTGTVSIGGTTGGTARATLLLGSGSSGTAVCHGQLLLAGHLANVMAGTVTLGRTSGSGGGSGQSGLVTLDNGTFDATSILMGNSTRAAALASTGTFTLGGDPVNTATLIVGSAGGGSLILGDSTVTTAGSSGAGTLNIYANGTARVYCNITKSATVGAVNTASINIYGGTLNMAALTNTLGDASLPIDSLTLSNSTMTLPVSASAPGAVVSTLTIMGTADTINISTLPPTSTFPAQYPVISYTSLAGSYDFALGAPLPGGYAGYLSNNTTSVDIVLTGTSSKTDTWNGNVSGNWDTSTLNWKSSGGATAYAQNDFVTFDDTLTGTPNVALTLNVAPAGLGFNNSSHNYVLSGAFKITGPTGLSKQGSGSVTLSESGGDDFSGGIIVNAGTLILDNANSAIAGGLMVNGGTVQIGNNDTNGALPGGAVTLNDSSTLVFNRTDGVAVSTGITGAGALSQNGSGTLTLSGANSYTGSTTIGNGTLALSGGGTLSNSTAVSVNAGTLDVSAVSPQTLASLTLNNGAITVAPNASGVPSISAASLTFAGAGNHINVSSFPPIASFPSTFTIVQSAGAASGSFNVTVGTLPAATPSYAANVTQSADHTAVLLTVTAGPVGVRQSVFWTGADVPNLNTNWSDRLNWQLPGAPSFGDNVIFTPTAAQTSSALSTPGGGASALVPDFINNIVDANFTVSSLTFTNLGGSYHNTYISSGKTLSLTNSGLTAGAVDSGATVQQELATISGAHATLNVAGTNANVQVWVGSGSVRGSQATLDLSALDTFNAAVSRLLVGAVIGNVVNQPSGILYLAKTNTISAGFQTTTSESGTATGNAGIVAADCNGNAGSTSYIYLGLANTIAADTIAIGRQKASGNLLFNPIYANIAPYPSVTFAGFSSNQVSIFDVGDGVGNTGTTTLTADANLTGGSVTAAVNTMNIGRASGGATGSGTTTGALEFDAGTITVNTLNIGMQPTTGSKIGIGTVGVSSNTLMGATATLTVRSMLNLGFAAGGAGAATTSGTLNITNGTVLAYSILPGTNSALSAINVVGGRLVVTNPVGNATTPLGTLTLASLGTPDNHTTVLSLAVRTNSAGLTVTTLNLDGLDTTTNIINVESVGPVGAVPVQLPLIQYSTMNLLSGGTFNVRLGTLPAGYSGTLVNDTANNAITLNLTAALHPQPRITGISVQSGTNLTLTGVNGFANVPYTVLATTNIAQPQATWSTAGTGVFANDGSFSFTAPLAASQQFFILQVP